MTDGEWIAVEIRKGTLTMVCDELYQTNLDENRGVTLWGIHCTDTGRYSWVSLTTTSQVSNSYR